MIPARRRRRKSERRPSAGNPGDIHIAFATRPDIHPEKYARRRMLETICRVMGNHLARTRSRAVTAAGMPCLPYPVPAHNIRGVADAPTAHDRVYPRVTQTDLPLNVLVETFPREIIAGMPPDGQCGRAFSCHRAPPAGIMPG